MSGIRMKLSHLTVHRWTEDTTTPLKGQTDQDTNSPPDDVIRVPGCPRRVCLEMAADITPEGGYLGTGRSTAETTSENIANMEATSTGMVRQMS